MSVVEGALVELIRVYEGSDGLATVALHERLEALGPTGALAAHLFRAQKASDRAKAYRGGDARGSYRSQAYDRKGNALDALCAVLIQHGAAGSWGWGVDEKQPVHKHVLYVELPTGQVSFHASARGAGPDYPRGWDGVPGRSLDRIVRFAARVLEGRA